MEIVLLYVKRMLDLNIPFDQISYITGLSVDIVENYYNTEYPKYKNDQKNISNKKDNSSKTM